MNDKHVHVPIIRAISASFILSTNVRNHLPKDWCLVIDLTYTRYFPIDGLIAF